MNDYGSIKDKYGNIRNDVPNYQNIKHTQVYMATHNGEGAKSRLPFMNRSFISFSFSDKKKNSDDEEKLVYIEDFNLIATISGDRLERKGYSEFEDLTSNYEVLDGHFYWGSHYTNHELTFDLATDAMTQQQLDSFLHWFQPGKVRELILSEHPNRAVMARVSSAPELHLLPFEEPTTKMIAGQPYKTSTTLYKGEITLTFIMEEPYWYSKINIFGYYEKETGVYHDTWIDVHNDPVNIFDDPDAIKIALEDNIPIASMIQTSMLLGDNTYANANLSDGAKTVNNNPSTGGFDNSNLKESIDICVYINTTNNKISCTVTEPTTYIPCNPSCTYIDNTLEVEDIELSYTPINNENFICYVLINADKTFNIAYKYGDAERIITTSGFWSTNVSGAADSIESNTNAFIMLHPTDGNIFSEVSSFGVAQLILPQNRTANTTINVMGQEIWIAGARITGAIMSESTGIEDFAANDKQYFYYAGNAPSMPVVEFTLTPQIDTNQNSDYFGYIISPKNTYSSPDLPYNTISFESLNKKELQFTTPSLYTGYNQVIKIFKEMIETAAWVDVRKLIRDYVNHPAARAWANKVIDSFESNTVGDSKINAIERMRYFLQDANGNCLDSVITIDSKTGRAKGQMKYRIPDNTMPNTWSTYRQDSIQAHEEDIGDMIRSNYLVIEDQNQPTDNGEIVAWSGDSLEQRLHSHIVRHDVENGLKNVFIKYNNMYL